MHFGPWLPWISEMRTTETQRKTKKKTGPQKTDGALELKRSKWGQNPSFHLAQERLPKYRFSSQVPDNLHYFGVILRFHRYIYIYIHYLRCPNDCQPFLLALSAPACQTKKRRHGDVAADAMGGWFSKSLSVEALSNEPYNQAWKITPFVLVTGVEPDDSMTPQDLRVISLL